jgi:predicted ATPase
VANPIEKITLKGYKSIRNLTDLELGSVNVLIGANGSGKSNFVSFFRLLRELVENRLEKAVNHAGGADRQLHLGPKHTHQIEAELKFGLNSFHFTLEATVDNRLIFGDERVVFRPTQDMSQQSTERSLGVGHRESQLKSQADSKSIMSIEKHIYNSISSWTVYHVHDTSDTASMRRWCDANDISRLRPQADNLAAFLRHLKQNYQRSYQSIVAVIQLIAPYFQDFQFPIKVQDGDLENTQLNWTQKDSDYSFHPSQLSDGTIRFIALVTALLQPHPPATILIDEPELGLHPFALETLGNLILETQKRTQIIVSTQSPSFLNSFETDQIIVVERNDGESSFQRLQSNQLQDWLSDYTLGELWQKNIYGGVPTYE